jgi:hypothetical protein
MSLLDKLKLIGLHKLVTMIFAVSFEIIIQRGVGNESYYPMKNTLITTVLSNRSRKNTYKSFYKYFYATPILIKVFFNIIRSKGCLKCTLITLSF